MARRRTTTSTVDAEKSEKITINVGLVDLGQIDLLVREGFFANRTDFIRTAIRRQLESRSDALERTVARRELVLGVQHFGRDALQQLQDSGQTVELRVLGLASIADDVSPELAAATIARVEVLGAFDLFGERLLFKIDYYHPDHDTLSPVPSSIELCRRVLTIMLADEY